MSFDISTYNPDTSKVEYRRVTLFNTIKQRELVSDRGERYTPGESQPRWVKAAIAELSRGLLDERYFYGRSPRHCPVCLREMNYTCRGWWCPVGCKGENYD